MNFIKQIEAALKAINQARFQDLINHFLHIQGNIFIGAPGSVVAKEKTSKGAPDSFFIHGDKFVFVECTTLEKLGNSKTFLEKLESDIEHCFEEEKTGIKKEEIEKIILACTDKISTDDFKQLKTKVYDYNSNTSLEVLDIQNLPMHIYDFPGLAEQYLGVEIVKGEIYNLPDFLIKTTKSLQPSLTNEFVGREEELKQSLDFLKNVDILLLSGSAGVGKSKLAVNILSEVSKDSYIPIVIQSSAVPLWDDFIHLFQNGKNYIILFDDANKSIQNLSYLLDFIQRPKTNKLKVVITSRDYVKQQVSQRLSNFKYKEIVIDKLKDKEIGEIILKALPNLQYNPDIKRKIIDLAKGNARVALMATYSVVPNAETNYLSSPVLLYEKYFEKIAEEIEVFSKTITLQALAVVSFFGVLDRNDIDINKILKEHFDIDWDELWVTILELHKNEILDVHSNEIVKVSDQVLATFAFYKCFIDSNSAVIDYGKWISTFIKSHPSRIKNTLIDGNNTFTYHHIRDLVLPHLNKVISNENENEFLYSFYSVFWFYKGYDTLIFLKLWVAILPSENQTEQLIFNYTHNNYTTPTKYFELLINFWNHPNELLKPALELGIELVAKQTSRLPEVLKFINDYFSYKWEDVQYGYQRQNILLNVLLSEKRSNVHKQIATGTFLNISEKLLGWHFTEFGTTKGLEFTIYNFDLYNSPELLELRNKILEGVYSLWNENFEQSNKILQKVIFPGGDIDKQIYIAELSHYRKLIADKLSVTQYAHCKFVKRLAEKITSTGTEIPEEWNLFINSDILRLSKLLKIEFEDRNGKSWQERQSENREEIQKYVLSKEWIEIESLIFSIDEFYKQQNVDSRWAIDYGISEIFIAISTKSKPEIEKALRIFFGGKILLPLQTRIISFILNENVLSGKDLLELIYEYEFGGKVFWIISLLNVLPENQINLRFAEVLIQTFKIANEPLPIHRMLDFVKYDSAFNDYKTANPGAGLEQHNVISYLTEILLSKQTQHKINLGFQFCQECHLYFSNHIALLKQAFIYLKQNDNHFDHDGKEFEAVLNMDSNFFIEYLQQKTVDSSYLLFRFENFKLDFIWSLPNYKEIANQALDILIKISPVYSNSEHPSSVLFTFNNANENLLEKAYDFMTAFVNEHYLDNQRIMMMMNIILHRFSDQFLKYLKQFLILNKEVESFKKIWIDKSRSYSGSRVPVIQRELDFCNEIIQMVKTLPDVLDYYKHIQYLEQRIGWLKKDIDNEQRRDFEDFFG